jgi:formate dehydrogenase subunit beta
MPMHYRLLNRGDVVGVAGKFLRDVWQRAGLQGMVVPRRGIEAQAQQPVFATDWLQLDRVDPFAPVMAANAARLVAQVASTRPRDRLGAVLRPCELRAVLELARRGAVDLERWITIGVECLGTFPVEDYAWRAERWGTQRLTAETLQFARLGGILPYRHRLACQMCAGPTPEGADLSLDVVGLPARQVSLVTARDEELARRLELDIITDGPAPQALIDQHARIRVALVARHGRAHKRLLGSLPPSMPFDVAGFQAHLAECAPCEACLDVCPLYRGQFRPGGNGDTAAGIRDWLGHCAGCGMCEQGCPQRLPLAPILDCIKQRLTPAPVPVR